MRRDPAAVRARRPRPAEEPLDHHRQLTQSIQDKLDEEDAHTIALCKQHGVIEKGKPARRRRRARK